VKTVAFIFLLLFLFLYSQQSGNWQQVEILDNTLCSSRKTECITNHQGEHILNGCFVYVEGEFALYLISCRSSCLLVRGEPQGIEWDV
jgi:hypothetical protein